MTRHWPQAAKVVSEVVCKQMQSDAVTPETCPRQCPEICAVCNIPQSMSHTKPSLFQIEVVSP